MCDKAQANKTQITFAGVLRNYDDSTVPPKPQNFQTFSKNQRHSLCGFYDFEKNGLGIRKYFLKKNSSPIIHNKYTND